MVRDEGSLNGIYVRIHGTVNLVSGSTVLIGEQVLTVSLARQPEDLPDAEGTYYSSSMPRPANLEVKQNLRGGAIGSVFRVEAESLVIGREGNDINFPEDPFISGRHAELRITGGVLSVTDLRVAKRNVRSRQRRASPEARRLRVLGRQLPSRGNRLTRLSVREPSMTVCNRAEENQDHHKFCLGCRQS